MKITKATLVRRGFAHRCPNCGERSLFPPQSLRIHRRCPACGTGFDRGDGFFLGPWVLNYTVAVFLYSASVLRAYRSDRITGLDVMSLPTEIFYFFRTMDVVG